MNENPFTLMFGKEPYLTIHRDDEPADGIGIVGVGKMPRVVRLGLSVWHRTIIKRRGSNREKDPTPCF